MPVITGGLLGRGRRRPPAYGGMGVPPVLFLRSSRHDVASVHCRLVLPLGPVSDFIRLSRPFRSFARGLPSAMNEIGPIPEGGCLFCADALIQLASVPLNEVSYVKYRRQY